MTHTRICIATALVALLAACGGGGGGGQSEAPQTPQASNELPAAALANSRALATYAATLARSETAEPLDVSKAMLPTSETDEPAEI